jgi:hypothetical protein
LKKELREMEKQLGFVSKENDEIRGEKVQLRKEV